ncbi:hypothetical protein HDV05_001268 [Chytridiales sp. JEL 0842]|nr:hypothetical protein HDV05_001268 [Chytridiales sp. JEL 0842]
MSISAVLDRSSSTVEERLQQYQKSFESLLELIPAKYYLPTDNSDEMMNKFAKNKKNAAPKQAIKEATKKAKKLKFDPEAIKSTADMQVEAHKAKVEKRKESLKPDNQPDSSSDQEEQALSETEDVPQAQAPAPIIPLPKPATIAELKEKVQKRIADLRAKRGAASNEKEVVKGAKSRSEILEKRLSKRKAKKEMLKKKKEQNSKTGKDIAGMNIPVDPKPKPSGATREVTENISFGKIDFASADDPDNPKKRKGPTDALGQLRKIEARTSKLEELKATNPEKAASIEEKAKWNKMLKMAEGEVVKDDVKLLKKTVKKKEKMKAASGKEWMDRKMAVRKSMLDKQKKRSDNLKARVEGKKAPGMRGVKKGSGVTKKGGKGGRPGFEGGARKKTKK